MTLFICICTWNWLDFFLKTTNLQTSHWSYNFSRTNGRCRCTVRYLIKLIILKPKVMLESISKHNSRVCCRITCSLHIRGHSHFHILTATDFSNMVSKLPQILVQSNSRKRRTACRTKSVRMYVTSSLSWMKYLKWKKCHLPGFPITCIHIG